MREFAFTREKAGGSSRGTTALLTTPYALDATRTPSAAGYSSRPPLTTGAPSVSDPRPASHFTFLASSSTRSCLAASRWMRQSSW